MALKSLFVLVVLCCFASRSAFADVAQQAGQASAPQVDWAAKLAAAESERDSLKKQLQDATALVNQHTTELDGLRKKLADGDSKLSSAKSQHTALDQELLTCKKSLEASHGSNTAELTKLKSEAAAVKAELSKAHADAQHRISTLEKQTSSAADLWSQIKSVACGSWKLVKGQLCFAWTALVDAIPNGRTHVDNVKSQVSTLYSTHAESHVSKVCALVSAQWNSLHEKFIAPYFGKDHGNCCKWTKEKVNYYFDALLAYKPELAPLIPACPFHKVLVGLWSVYFAWLLLKTACKVTRCLGCCKGCKSKAKTVAKKTGKNKNKKD